MNSSSKKNSTVGSIKNNRELRQNASKTYHHKGKSRGQMDFTCLEKMFDNKLLCDFTFIVDGFELRVHKVILSICSTLFYWQFSKDRKSSSFNNMEVDFISYTTLSAVIGYLYTSEITITEDNVAELMTAASRFVLRDLQRVCQEFLKTKLRPDNCVTFGIIARQFQCEEVIALADDYIKSNFEEVGNHGEFLELSCEQVESLISGDAVCATEETVLQCVLQWVRFDLSNRRDCIHQLLKHVRFARIPQSKALQMLEKEQWLKSDPGYNSILGEIFKRYIQDEPSTSQHFSRQRPKLRDNLKVMVVAGINPEARLSIELYNFNKDTWINVPNTLEIGEVRGKPAIVGSKIYCFGDTLISIDFSNPNQMVWSDCGKVLEDEKIIDIVGLDGAIYILSHDPQSEVKLQTLDLSSFTCKRLPDPIDTGNERMVAGKGHIYTYKDTICCFNPNSNSWRLLSGIDESRLGAGASVVGNALYLVGGGIGTIKRAAAFNLSDCSMRKLPDLNVGRYMPGVIGVNDKLYLMGGYSINSVEVFDLNLNTWTMLPIDMKTPKYKIVAAIVD